VGIVWVQAVVVKGRYRCSRGNVVTHDLRSALRVGEARAIRRGVVAVRRGEIPARQKRIARRGARQPPHVVERKRVCPAGIADLRQPRVTSFKQNSVQIIRRVIHRGSTKVRVLRLPIQLVVRLGDILEVFSALTPAEQSEALQCVLKRVAIHPGKVTLDIFELEKFCASSQKRKEWLSEWGSRRPVAMSSNGT